MIQSQLFTRTQKIAVLESVLAELKEAPFVTPTEIDEPEVPPPIPDPSPMTPVVDPPKPNEVNYGEHWFKLVHLWTLHEEGPHTNAVSIKDANKVFYALFSPAFGKYTKRTYLKRVRFGTHKYLLDTITDSLWKKRYKHYKKTFNLFTKHKGSYFLIDVVPNNSKTFPYQLKEFKDYRAKKPEL